jgi:galactokinase
MRTTADDARAHFRRTFGAEPDVVASAPGRVNVIGEHTDYNGGQVLPIAIDRRTYVAMRARPNGALSRIVSDNQPVPAEFDIRDIAPSDQWWDYVVGVATAFEATGARLPQLDAIVTSDVPPGSGLSSSAALELASAVAIAGVLGENRDHKDLARLSWTAETSFVGVSCGVMDQFASALCEKGNALHLWCDTLETEQVPMRESVLIFDTNAPRSLRSSEFNQRQLECREALRLLRQRNPALDNLAAARPSEVRAARLPRILEKRALHVTEENLRVESLVEELHQSGTVAGEILLESHESLRTQYECSTPELDWFVDNVRVISGVRGARLTGAGWGGCAIAVGDNDALDGAREELSERYTTFFGRSPRTWLTKAEHGAKRDWHSR